MSASRGLAKRPPAAQQYYSLGEAGRKTGVVLKDDGHRDVNGMQPLDNLFSSPGAGGVDGSTPKGRREDSGEMEMDIDRDSSPGPGTVMRQRRSGASLLADGPVQGKKEQQPVKRNLFAESPEVPVRRRIQREEEEEEEAAADVYDESMHLVQDFVPSDDDQSIPDYNAPEIEESIQEPEPPRRPTPRQNPATKRRYIPPNEPSPPASPSPSVSDPSDNPVAMPSPKRQRTQKPLSKTPVSKKPVGRQVKPSPGNAQIRKARGKAAQKKVSMDDEEVGDKSLMEVQRGPPAPKRRGLMAARNEGVVQTRSGRSSFRPLQFWKGERVEAEEEEVRDVSGKGAFVVSSFKEVVRVKEDEDVKPARRRRGPTQGKTAAKKTLSSSDRKPKPQPKEPWETQGGIIEGEVILYQNPPGSPSSAPVVTEPLALSADAVVTHQVHAASFAYGKTMSVGFMGSGIVDFPAGTEKATKNSRRMQLVFFVAYGRVLVQVHNNTFRIGTGGQFFVPRGNYYSIKNDYDGPARLFFAQGCEVEAGADGDDDSSGR